MTQLTPEEEKNLQEEFNKSTTRLIDSERSRAMLPRGVNVRDGGRVICETIFVNKILQKINEILEKREGEIIVKIEKLNDRSMKRYKEYLMSKEYGDSNDISNDEAMAIAIRNEIINLI